MSASTVASGLTPGDARSRLVTECVDGCEFGDDEHDCCGQEHWDCDGRGCDRCWDGLLFLCGH